MEAVLAEILICTRLQECLQMSKVIGIISQMAKNAFVFVQKRLTDSFLLAFYVSKTQTSCINCLHHTETISMGKIKK